MKKIIIRYGIYSSLTLIVLFGLTFLLGKNLDFGASEKLGYASILIGMIFVYLGIREYRETIGEGKISFWKAVKVGLLIVSIPSIAFGLIDVVYVTFINPDFIENFTLIFEPKTTYYRIDLRIDYPYKTKNAIYRFLEEKEKELNKLLGFEINFGSHMKRLKLDLRVFKNYKYNQWGNEELEIIKPILINVITTYKMYLNKAVEKCV